VNLNVDCFIGSENEQNIKGLYALEKIVPQTFNLICIPPYNPDDVDPDVIGKAAEYCERKKAFLIVDSPSTWKTVQDAENGLSAIGTNSKNAAIYFPRIIKEDVLHKNQLREFAPSGTIAGVYASTDIARGVWKAPAGVNACLNGVVDLTVKISDDDKSRLNPFGINCLRNFQTYGNVVWGARTLENSEWNYVNVRRLVLYIEQSIEESITWAVFESNDETLWSSLRLDIISFLDGLYKQGAFPGWSADEAFYVKVDSTTTTQSDIDRGVVNIMVGIAPVAPAEFIILSFEQTTG